MANFNTHFSGAIIGSGLLATACYNTYLVNATEMEALWMTGTLAGLLPDLDAKNSLSLKVIFNTISLLTSAIIVIVTARKYPLLWTVAIIFGVYLLLRYLFLPVFKGFTVHRGNWHTLLSGFCVSLFVINITWNFMGVSARYAWLSGLFTGTGFLIHLLLDEIYAFNIKTMRFKRSFGSAIKPFNAETPFITFVISSFSLIQFWYLPPWSVVTSLAKHLTLVHLV